MVIVSASGMEDNGFESQGVGINTLHSYNIQGFCIVIELIENSLKLPKKYFRLTR
jgi:hypothetical protein